MQVKPQKYKSQSELIQNSQTEGELHVIDVKPLKLNIAKLILSIFLCLCTGLILAIIFRFSQKVLIAFVFSAATIETATHVLAFNEDGTSDICKMRQIGQVSFFVQRYLKYVLKSREGKPFFKALEKEFRQPEDFQGVTQSSVQEQQKIYGKCHIEVPIPSVFAYLLDVMTRPFYFIQYFSCSVWLLEELYYLSLQLICISIGLTLINYIFYRVSLLQLRKLAKSEIRIKVYRPKTAVDLTTIKEIKNEETFEISSKELVPGDLVVLEEHKIPCDMYLVSGDVLVNEANLTGETNPVQKENVQNFQQALMEKDIHEEQVNYTQDKSHILFEGTEIMKTKATNHSQILGLVLRTGYASFKGQVFRRMLYPKKTIFELFMSGLKMSIVISVMGIIVMLCIVPTLIEYEIMDKLIALRVVSTLTFFLPPDLPIFLAISQGFNQARLRVKNIFTLNAEKTIVAGGIQVMCFDKTGTLTISGMKVLGYLPSQSTEKTLIKEYNEIDAEKYNQIFRLFASCHGVSKLKNQLVGDQLDQEMLQFSKYQIEEIEDPKIKFRTTNTKGDALQVEKLFPFVSELQRMSCIARTQSDQQLTLFVKGSPEKLRDLCDSSSIPQNFDSLVEEYACQGLRVIALAQKSLPNKDFNSADAERSDLEKDLQYIGLLVLENKLKDDTRVEILKLRDSNLECKVISGDNVLTTTQTAIDSGIIMDSTPILFVDYDQKTGQLLMSDAKSKMGLASNGGDGMTTNTELNEEIALQANQGGSNSVIQSLQAQINKQVEQEIVLTGPAFQYLQNKEQTQLLQDLCAQCRVFARMKPFQKDEIIQYIQKNGFKVGMIGDGINDLSAINQAHVGISFSNADSSFSAAFSSKDQSIRCVQKILMEGRCSLQILTEIYHFVMVAQSISFIAIAVMLFEAAMFTDFQLMFLINLNYNPYVLSICFSAPFRKLTKVMPQTNLFTWKSFNIIFGQSMIFSVLCIIIYNLYVNTGFYVHNEELAEWDWWNQEIPIHTPIFLAAQIFTAFLIFAQYTGKPFKRPIFFNIILTLLILINLAYLIVLTWYQDAQFTELYMDDTFYNDKDFQVACFVLIMVAGVLSVAHQMGVNRIWTYKNELKKNFHLEPIQFRNKQF